MGTQSPPQKGAEPPTNFRPMFIVAKRLDPSRCHLVWTYASAQGTCVLDGDPAPLPKRGGAPEFSAHVYCGQTAGWIKMTLGMDVGVFPGHIVLGGDPAPLPKKGQSPTPNFRPIFIVAKRLDASSRCHLV